MDKQIIEKAVEYVKSELEGVDAGHDWWHIYRVWQLSKNIAQHENVDMFVVELGALLHDVGEPKFHNGDETIGEKRVREFLSSVDVSKEITEHVVNILNNISYKKTFEKNEDGTPKKRFKSPELDVVQDADRLDSMGAIGVARTFTYGGFNDQEMYNPNLPADLNLSKEEYKKGGRPTINHFYEKLLLLKDMMNTETGKRMAEQRHEFMEMFLKQFYEEWDGKK